MRFALVIYLLLGTLAASPLLAKTPVAELQRLMQAGEPTRAYELGQRHQDELAGQRDFDLYFGLAAVASGHSGEGVFALERVLMREPDLPRAQLALGRGYLSLGQSGRARQWFRRVLRSEATPALDTAARQELAGLEAPEAEPAFEVNGYLALSGGRDTNVNLAPDRDSIRVASGQSSNSVALADDEQARSDSFARLDGGVQLNYPVGRAWRWLFTGNASRRLLSDTSAFDTSYGQLGVGAERERGPSRLRMMAWGQRFMVDGDTYRDTVEAEVAYDYVLSQSVLLRSGAVAGRRNLPEQSIRDARFWTLSAGTRWQGKGSFRPSLEATLFGGQDSAEENSDAAEAVAERDRVGIAISGNLEPAPNWRTELSWRWQANDYDNRSLAFQRRRESDYRKTELRIEWEPARRWRLGATVSHRERDANIELYDYDRTKAALRLRYGFF